MNGPPRDDHDERPGRFMPSASQSVIPVVLAFTIIAVMMAASWLASTVLAWYRRS